MAVYRVAGVLVKMDPHYEHLRKYAEKYLYTGKIGDEEVIDIDAPESVLATFIESNPGLSEGECEYILNGAKFAVRLLRKKGFVLHSSAVAYEGGAYLFSADSGTGKSTHTAFWQECFGKDKAVIINDDKPAIREVDGVFYVSGTPFSGKSDLNNNITVPVKAVCFIYRSEKNEIRRLSAGEALECVMNQTIRPSRSVRLENLLDLLNAFLKKVPVYSLGVTYSPDSARFAYEKLNSSSL